MTRKLRNKIRKGLHYTSLVLSPLILMSIIYYITIWCTDNKIIIDGKTSAGFFALLFAVAIMVCSNTSMFLYLLGLVKKLEKVIVDNNILLNLILQTNLKHDENVKRILEERENDND